MIDRFLGSALLAGALLTAHAASAETKPTVAPAAAAGQAAQTFKAWDTNADGQLSPVEFQAGWQRAQASAALQVRLRRQFASIDANRDGGIDAREYANLVLIKNAGATAPPLKRFDTDGSAKLNFVEYTRLVESLASRPDAKK